MTSSFLTNSARFLLSSLLLMPIGMAVADDDDDNSEERTASGGSRSCGSFLEMRWFWHYSVGGRTPLESSTRWETSVAFRSSLRVSC